MIESILIAVLVVAGIGLVCGILLAVASHFMSVKENEKKSAVRNCLPGANCGACGYAGCDGYAEALAEGKAATNLCVPGADAVSKKISEVLGVEFQDVVEQVAFVHCNGSCGKTEKKQEYEGIKSCSAAKLIYGGPGSCTFGCIGYGDCMAVCPNGAICLDDGIARIDTRKCVGCGLCVKACPQHIITLFPDVQKTVVMCSNKEKGAVARKKCTSACIGCKKCELNCPSKAVKVVNNLAVIDYDLCTDCGLCAENCPVKCIKIADFSGEHRFE